MTNFVLCYSLIRLVFSGSICLYIFYLFIFSVSCMDIASASVSETVFLNFFRFSTDPAFRMI